MLVDVADCALNVASKVAQIFAQKPAPSQIFSCHQTRVRDHLIRWERTLNVGHMTLSGDPAIQNQFSDMGH